MDEKEKKTVKETTEVSLKKELVTNDYTDISQRIVESAIQYINDNPLANEQAFKDYIISISKHTKETVEECISSVIKALHEALIIDHPNFISLRKKAIDHTDLDLKTLMKIINSYEKLNPPQFKILEMIAEIDLEIAEINKLPDQITVLNDAKYIELSNLEIRKKGLIDKCQ